MNHVTLSVRLLMLAVVNVGVIAASHVQIATHLDHTIGLLFRRFLTRDMNVLRKTFVPWLNTSPISAPTQAGLLTSY